VDTAAKDMFSEHAQALAISSGCLSDEADWLALAALERGEGMAKDSSFCLHCVFEAFAKM